MLKPKQKKAKRHRMKNIKKKILMLISACAFVALMLFNVSVSMDGSTDMISNVSLSGIELLANPQGEDCDGVSCAWDGWGYRCFYTGDYGISCNDGSYPDCRERPC
jgi:hypothetical protein